MRVGSVASWNAGVVTVAVRGKDVELGGVALSPALARSLAGLLQSAADMAEGATGSVRCGACAAAESRAQRLADVLGKELLKS